MSNEPDSLITRPATHAEYRLTGRTIVPLLEEVLFGHFYLRRQPADLLSFSTPSPFFKKSIHCQCPVNIVNLRSAMGVAIHNQLPPVTN